MNRSVAPARGDVLVADAQGSEHDRRRSDRLPAGDSLPHHRRGVDHQEDEPDSEHAAEEGRGAVRLGQGGPDEEGIVEDQTDGINGWFLQPALHRLIALLEFGPNLLKDLNALTLQGLGQVSLDGGDGAQQENERDIGHGVLREDRSVRMTGLMQFTRNDAGFGVAQAVSLYWTGLAACATLYNRLSSV